MFALPWFVFVLCYFAFLATTSIKILTLQLRCCDMSAENSYIPISHIYVDTPAISMAVNWYTLMTQTPWWSYQKIFFTALFMKCLGHYVSSSIYMSGYVDHTPTNFLGLCTFLVLSTGCHELVVDSENSKFHTVA